MFIKLLFYIKIFLNYPNFTIESTGTNYKPRTPKNRPVHLTKQMEMFVNSLKSISFFLPNILIRDSA